MYQTKLFGQVKQEKSRKMVAAFKVYPITTNNQVNQFEIY